jgi:glycosyltransferase involved in cell wall biosynthesis
MNISVVTAVYNRVDTLGDAIASIARQDHGKVEHVVIDGGSTDGTLAVIQRHRARIAKVVSEPDRGIYDALNKGLKHATGEVVGFLHADDLFAADDTLSRVAHAFEDPAVDVVYGDLVYVRKDDTDSVVRWWTAGAFDLARLARGWMPPHPTFYARRSVYERWGGFDTSLRIAADYDFMLRVLSSGRVCAAYIPEVMIRMRVGGASNRSLRNIVRKSREDARAMRTHGIAVLPALAGKNFGKLGQFFPGRRV